jgi:hypothetical protein
MPSGQHHIELRVYRNGELIDLIEDPVHIPHIGSKWRNRLDPQEDLYVSDVIHIAPLTKTEHEKINLITLT